MLPPWLPSGPRRGRWALRCANVNACMPPYYCDGWTDDVLNWCGIFATGWRYITLCLARTIFQRRRQQSDGFAQASCSARLNGTTTSMRF
jgi:hypothetical protein